MATDAEVMDALTGRWEDTATIAKRLYDGIEQWPAHIAKTRRALAWLCRFETVERREGDSHGFRIYEWRRNDLGEEGDRVETERTRADVIRDLVAKGPVNKKEIYDRLGIPPKHKGTRSAYRDALNQEIWRGHIICDEKGNLTIGDVSNVYRQAQCRTYIVEQKIRDYFAQGKPGYMIDICDDLGYNVDTVRRHLRRMGATYTLDGKKRVWRLPEEKKENDESGEAGPDAREGRSRRGPEVPRGRQAQARLRGLRAVVPDQPARRRRLPRQGGRLHQEGEAEGRIHEEGVLEMTTKGCRGQRRRERCASYRRKEERCSCAGEGPG